MSAGSGPTRRRPSRAQRGQHRFDHVDFLAAEMAGFAGVRIEAEHRDHRLGDAEVAAQRRVR